MCNTYLVIGRVQGVFYRASAREQADKLGLRGWVRNLPDGRVETYACGDSERVAEYERWLRSGPPLAKVSAIEIAVSCCTEIEGFEIR